MEAVIASDPLCRNCFPASKLVESFLSGISDFHDGVSRCGSIFIHFSKASVSRVFNSANAGICLKVNFLNCFFDDFLPFLFGTPIFQILEL